MLSKVGSKRARIDMKQRLFGEEHRKTPQSRGAGRWHISLLGPLVGCAAPAALSPTRVETTLS